MVELERVAQANPAGLYQNKLENSNRFFRFAGAAVHFDQVELADGSNSFFKFSSMHLGQSKTRSVSIDHSPINGQAIRSDLNL